MKTPPVTSLEPLFRALADNTRLRILALLAAGEICVCHIHGALAIPQPMASRHLAYLRRTGLVATRKDGLWVHYRIAVPSDPAMAAVLAATIEALRSRRGISNDRRKLSGLTAIPMKVLEETVSSCCR